MTPIEAKAFNNGVVAVLDIAAAAARAIRSAPGYRMVRDEFAAEALAASVDEGRALLVGDAGNGGVITSPSPVNGDDGLPAPAVAQSAEGGAHGR